MGLFKKRTKEPLDVGNALCAIDDAGHGYVGQRHHEAVTPEAIAALAPITFAINIAMGFSSRSNSEAQHWIESILAFGDAAALTSEVNYAGVTTFDDVTDPNATMRAVAIGKFQLLPTSALMGTWMPQGRFNPDEDAMPLLGVLMAAAVNQGADGVVWHAHDMLSSADIDFSNPAVLMDLPQVLLDYGAQQAGLDDLKFQ